jgi:4-hydroxybenzoate polyprenyltransferase
VNRPRLLAFAQLLRLPNVFTAFADVAMAASAGGYALDRPGVFALLLAASGCLYLGGMVWNDVFDRHEDAAARPFRPIPSGRVGVRTAVLLACVLSATGLAAGLAGGDAWTAPALLACVLLYDAWLKRTPVGPVAMGGCRFLNVLLGLSAAPDVPDPLRYHLAAVVGVYIVGVTWFARTEEGASNRRHLVAASLVMLVAAGLAITVPAHLPPGTATVLFPYLVVAFAVYVGAKLVEAIRTPGPKQVQAAVKRSILALVILDAVLATAFAGAWGLLVLLLLLPARWLGKWVYST